jgi:glucoamylase
MLAQASEGGLIPEQVWDASDIPSRRLRCGHASGSAMPLVWAHAELVKLCRSIGEQRVFDTPPSVAMRYLRDYQRSTLDTWWVDGPVSREHPVPVGSTLRVECGVPFALDWRVDGAESTAHRASADSGLGVHFADVPLRELPAGAVARIVVDRDGRGGTGPRGRRSEHVVRVGGGDG